MAKRKKPSAVSTNQPLGGYGDVLGEIAELLEISRRTAARSVNAVMTLSYGEIGRRIVEFEQGDKNRAEYGKAMLEQLSADLTTRFGRGFSVRNLRSMRKFYQSWPIRQTLSTALNDPREANQFAKESQLSIQQTLSAKLSQAITGSLAVAVLVGE